MENIEEWIGSLSHNQKKIIRALLDAPEGILSQDLALKTGVSNKSGTVTPELREILKDHGFELVIERSGRRGSLWALKPLKAKVEFVTIHMGDDCVLRVTKEQAEQMFDELSQIFCVESEIEIE